MNTYGAIAIDAESVKLKIVEKHKNGYKTLEDVSVEINLRSDLINSNKILRSSVADLVECLKSYKRTLKEYGVKTYKVVATGTIRKAPNGKFMIGYISKKLNLKIEILEEPVERFLTYLSLNKKLEDYEKIKNEGMLFVEVGSTSSELIVFRKSKIVVSSQIPVGIMKMKTLMQNTDRISGDTIGLLSDYVSGMIENLDKYITRKKLNHYIAYGSNICKMLEITGNNSNSVNNELIDSFAKKMFNQDVEFMEYVESFHLDYNALLCELIILMHFYNMISDIDVYVPEISLRDGVIHAIVEKMDEYQRDSDITRDIISCARQIAKKYNSTPKHISRVESNFIKLFDSYKEEEGFTEKDLLIGRMVCILHEIGKFSRQIDYYDASYRNIVNANLLGVEMKVLNEVAETTLQFFYFTHRVVAKETFENSENKRVKIALLAALSYAMDKSKKQNVMLVRSKVSGDKLKLNIQKNGKCYLEMWEIDRMREFFLDVFGHDIIIE